LFLSKVTLTDITKVDSTVISAVNANNAAIETGFDNTLSLDGTSPNTMAADIDMDGNTLLNLPAPSDLTSPVRLQDINDLEAGGILDNQVANEKLADMPSMTFKGRLFGEGDPEDIPINDIGNYITIQTWLEGYELRYIEGLYVNSNFDPNNRVVLKANDVLVTTEDTNVQVKLNKADIADSATFLFQTNWSGRAEIGTSGNDDFSFKVSPDGSNWYTGLTLKSGAKGVPVLPSFATGDLPAAATAGAGALAFDSTVGKAVCSDGSTWTALW